MQRPNRFFDLVTIAWPRVLMVRRVFQANMDVPHALARPMLRAELTSPMRFPGVKHSAMGSVITVQSRLRGLPYFDSLALDQAKLRRLNLTTQSAPRAVTGTKRTQ